MHDAKFNELDDKLADLRGRLTKLENTPIGGIQPQQQKPRAPLDAASILDALMLDPEIGPQVRLKVHQLKQGHAR